jgi:hypothetical protein
MSNRWAWSANYMADPPQLHILITRTALTLSPDEAWFLYNATHDFLADCKNNVVQQESQPIPLEESDIVDRAKAALKGVTAGPWETHVWPMPGHTIEEWYTREIVHPNGAFHPLNVLKARHARHADEQCCWPPTEADAEFIAAARTLIPELIEEIERLRKGRP